MADPRGVPLPPKDPGGHRWIAIATYTLTPGQAAACHGGASVKLGTHNLVSTVVGCVDCEAEWPAPQRCTAAAAPEMANLTRGPKTSPELSQEEQERLFATVDLIQRSGAKGFELGHLEDNVPAHLARWYAHATYKGQRITAEEHANPIDAAEALAWKVLEGGRCTHCEKTIALEGHEGPVGACRWYRVKAHWVPGCIEPGQVEGYILERQRRNKRP